MTDRDQPLKESGLRRRPSPMRRVSLLAPCMNACVAPKQRIGCAVFSLLFGVGSESKLGNHHASCVHRTTGESAYVIPGRQMTLMTWRLLNRSFKHIHACIISEFCARIS